ncbi:hypothetical protein GWI33_021121 [Rhynchophorus ferrugineus]|uniref:Uncharacterized protein n=1 Tax=Rhynchophorus ferrugineus TaxID=354439 RepID=A0A834LYW2_RHYFE|nr:hypothetical protein GWI33_021121 [Rhynchophorus ferrugineus]
MKTNTRAISMSVPTRAAHLTASETFAFIIRKLKPPTPMAARRPLSRNVAKMCQACILMHTDPEMQSGSSREGRRCEFLRNPNVMVKVMFPPTASTKKLHTHTRKRICGVDFV